MLILNFQMRIHIIQGIKRYNAKTPYFYITTFYWHHIIKIQRMLEEFVGHLLIYSSIYDIPNIAYIPSYYNNINIHTEVVKF